MIILTSNSISSQNLYFIPRGTIFTSVKITDEQTNVTTDLINYTYQIGDYTYRLNAIFNLKENHFYTIEFKNNSKVVFRDKIFCTDQNVTTFSVNKDEYTSNNTTNTFIVYE
jgi:hypothetical protein